MVAGSAGWRKARRNSRVMRSRTALACVVSTDGLAALQAGVIDLISAQKRSAWIAHPYPCI